MNGLNLSREYYLQFGKPMLEEKFSDVLDYLTIGVVGEGSECFGYDDNLSCDHDFDVGFCIFIDEEQERKFGFPLERAYAKLPKEFMGYKRPLIAPSGGSRRGVIVTENFYQRLLGATRAPRTNLEWLKIEESSLAVLSSGQIFKEGTGLFMEIRNAIKNGYPDDVKKKKLASHLAFMAQSGQYNYSRCVARKENGSAQLAIFEFVTHAVKCVYLLNDKYCPFYKWAFRGMRDLKILSDIEDVLVYLLETPNDEKTAEYKQGIIDDVARMIITELKTQNLTSATCNNLDTHAFSVTDKIKDNTLRNMHVMEGTN